MSLRKRDKRCFAFLDFKRVLRLILVISGVLLYLRNLSGPQQKRVLRWDLHNFIGALPLSLSRPLNKNVLYVGIFINFISALLLSLSSQPKRVLRLDKFHQLHEAFSSAGILRQVGIILYQFVINPSPCVILSSLAHSAIVYGNEITLGNSGEKC